MKLSLAALVILLAATVATAQKKDPILVGSHSNHHAATMQRSVSPQAVAAVLNRKSTTSSDLAKIERGPANHPNAPKPAIAHTSPKKFGVGQDNTNKPMNASKPGRVGRPSFHTKTKAS